MNNKFCRKIILLGVFILPLLISACGKKDAVNISAPVEIATVETVAEGQIPVDVYMDATVSMQGYTTISNGNLYRTLPDFLTDIGDSMGEVAFYKFGADVTKLSGREHRAYSSPAPYTEIITAVHNVVDTANEEHLSVIVTDLFESDSDWSNVTKKLKDKYFAKHLAVAVIGIKNPFNGDIFDVGLNALKYNYNSGDDPARYRPFYLLVMGKEQKVREFMELFKTRVSLPNEMEFLLLSEHLTDGAFDFTKMEFADEGKNLYENSSLGLKDPTMREFGASDKKKEAKFSVPFKYQPIFGAPPVDMKAVNIEARGFALLGEGEWEKIDISEDSKVSLESVRDNDYKVHLDFKPRDVLAKGKVNMINVRIYPNAKTYALPSWVNAWSMADVDIDQSNFDGAKTAHLNHVLESLKSSALSAATPILFNINLVFDER